MVQTPPLHLDRAQRFPLEFPVRFRTDAMPHWIDGKTVNISRTGILVLSDVTVPASAILDIRVDFPRNVTLKCRGTILRCEESTFAVKIRNCHLLHQL
jgi:hypothetical protein